MKPGRELDKLVVEKVLGLTAYCRNEIGPPFYFTRYILVDEGENSGDMPYYSTNIASAFTVDKSDWLWEFQEMPAALSVTLYTSSEIMREAIRDFPILPKDAILIRRQWLDDKAQTYAWLRCLAALRAVGVEVGDGL